MNLSDLAARLRGLSTQLQREGRYDPATEPLLTMKSNGLVEYGGRLLIFRVGPIVREAREQGAFDAPHAADFGLLIDGNSDDPEAMVAIFRRLKSRGFNCWGLDPNRGALDRLADAFDAIGSDNPRNADTAAREELNARRSAFLHGDANGSARHTDVVDGNPKADEVTPNHSADFTFVEWYGTEYTFALGVQSSAVKVLWEEWEASGLGLHQDTIRNAVDPERDTFRMDTAFRNNPAFGDMIMNAGDGRYRLNPPGDGKIATGPKGKKSAGITSKARRKRV